MLLYKINYFFYFYIKGNNGMCNIPTSIAESESDNVNGSTVPQLLDISKEFYKIVNDIIVTGQSNGNCQDPEIETTPSTNIFLTATEQNIALNISSSLINELGRSLSHKLYTAVHLDERLKLERVQKLVYCLNCLDGVGNVMNGLRQVLRQFEAFTETTTSIPQLFGYASEDISVELFHPSSSENYADEADTCKHFNTVEEIHSLSACSTLIRAMMLSFQIAWNIVIKMPQYQFEHIKRNLLACMQNSINIVEIYTALFPALMQLNHEY